MAAIRPKKSELLRPLVEREQCWDSATISGNLAALNNPCCIVCCIASSCCTRKGILTLPASHRFKRLTGKHSSLCQSAMTSSLFKAFQWPVRLFQCAQQLLAPSTIDKSVLLSGQGSDSDFSGGAAGWEAAAEFLSAAGKRWCYNIDIQSRSACATRFACPVWFQSSCAVVTPFPQTDCTAQEKNVKMQMSLRTRVTEQCCIFPDIMDIYEAGSKPAYNYIAEGKGYSQKLERAQGLATKSHGWCVQHQRYCAFCKDTSVRVGGFPCQDFSSAGKQEGLDGVNLPLILGCGRKAQETASNVQVVENVPSCPRHLAYDAWGSSYSWCAEQVFTPTDVGFDCVNRPRQLS